LSAGAGGTGKEVTFSGVSIYRFAIGRIVEGWSNWDTIGLMQQLGVIPSAARV